MKLKPHELNKNLQKNCDQFCSYTQKNLTQFLSAEFFPTEEVQCDAQGLNQQDIHISILFNGSVYGEFILSLNKTLASQLVMGSPEKFDENKEEIFETFKEIVNISVGKTMEDLGQYIDHLSITSPKVTIGQLYLPKFPVYTQHLQNTLGTISCSLYIDQMQLTIANAYSEKKEQLEESEQEKEQLRRLNKTKTEFLANMSHELRTPLNGMIGHLDLLKNTSLSLSQRQQVNTIAQSGDFLLGIINDILEFSKIEAGHLQVEIRDFDLEKSLEQFVDIIANQVYLKGLDFFVNISPEVPTRFTSDETRIRQVLMNLIGNSIKFTPKGSINLNVYLEGDFVKFKVEDTGIGIPPKKLKTIFDSFSQADISDNRKYGGSGLGLTISKSIIEALHGQISVESIEAKGTCFSFTIPLIETPHESSQLSLQKATNPLDEFKNKESLNKLIPEENKFYFISNNKLLYKNFEFYTQNCLQKNQITFLKSWEETSFRDKSTIIMDSEEWAKFSQDMKNKFIQSIKNEKSSANNRLLILSNPETLSDLEEDEKLLSGISGSIIKKPITPSKLKAFFYSQGIISFHESSTEIQSKKAKVSKQNNKILLVEDNIINQQVSQAMLELLGLDVHVAANGEEAVEICQKNKYDLILMDCQMPIMDGYSATTQIRVAGQLNEKTPIIALTANAFKEIKEKCFEHGMDDFTTKPIKQDDLKEVIERYL